MSVWVQAAQIGREGSKTENGCYQLNMTKHPHDIMFYVSACVNGQFHQSEFLIQETHVFSDGWLWALNKQPVLEGNDITICMTASVIFLKEKDTWGLKQDILNSNGPVFQNIKIQCMLTKNNDFFLWSKNMLNENTGAIFSLNLRMDDIFLLDNLQLQKPSNGQ